MSDKRIALVTGGSRGIGADICKRLGKDGFHVLVNYASNEAKAKVVVDAIAAAGGSAELCGFDVSNPDQVKEKVADVTKRVGLISTLVNNAGISIDGLLLRLKNEDLDRTLDIDLKGAIYCTREVARPMIKAKGGSIVNISSVIGEMGNAGQGAYSAAKAGLLGFTKSSARELASRAIRVNALTPGFIKTEMTDSLTDDQKSGIRDQIPLGTLGSGDDIAAAVSFLCSDGARYITGQVLGINGGLYM